MNFLQHTPAGLGWENWKPAIPAEGLNLQVLQNTAVALAETAAKPALTGAKASHLCSSPGTKHTDGRASHPETGAGARNRQRFIFAGIPGRFPVNRPVLPA